MLKEYRYNQNITRAETTKGITSLSVSISPNSGRLAWKCHK